MKFQKALESKRRFRLPEDAGYCNVADDRVRDCRGEVVVTNVTRLLREDWEVEEACVTVTESVAKDVAKRLNVAPEKLMALLGMGAG